jgi:diguanylate cyclase (GGDEF)-like protein
VVLVAHHILYVDDEPHNLDAFKRAFRGVDFVEKVHVADSPSAALALLEHAPVSVVVTDQRMPEMTGTEFLARMIVRWPDPVRLVLTGYTDVADILDAINRGHIYFFITKPWDPNELVLTVRRACEHYDREQELRRKNRELAEAYQRLEAAHRQQVELYERVVTDDKTGVKNYHYFRIRLVEEFDRARRYGKDLGLIMLDIDGFKALNDRHGHPAGDAVLRELAHLLGAGQRSVDVIARYGGEEFAALLPETGPLGARAFAERLRQRVASHGFSLPGGERIGVQVSCGVAAYPQPEISTPDTLVARADAALYRAKAEGKNRVCADGE